MKSINLFTLLALYFFISACSNPDNKNEATNHNDNDSKKAVTLDTFFYKKLNGTINESINITMDLVKNDSILSGSYYYNKIGKPLKLYGRLSKTSNEIELIEYNDKGDKTGTFHGSFDSNNNFMGNWTNAANNKIMVFALSPSTANNAASATFKHYRNENCKTRDSLLKIMKAEDIPYYQGSCSYIDINLLTIQTENKQVSKIINAAILKDICHDIGETQYNTISEYLASINNLSEDDIYQMDVTCNIATNDKNILSMDVSNSSYTGGAHPNSWSKIYNFDLRTGNIIKLDDLIMSGGEEKLSTIAESIFVKEYGNEGWDFKAGDFPLAVNFSISLGGIHFFYNSYEIGSYAMGAPDIFIPYKDIKQLIKPQSIVSELMLK